MKIPRLYKLSQFIDEITLDFKEDDHWMAEAYLAIHRYNNFLKQPLTKDMFVCEIEEPTDSYNSEQYYGAEMDAYEAAQKKVIFEDEVWFYYGVLGLIKSGKTIHDLAEATNGELKLKNVEL